MKYILLSLVFFTQLFANDANKTITVYGYVSEQVVHSSITDKKESYYILDAYYVDGKDVGSKYFQLLFDTNKTNITTPSDRLKKKYKLKGIILESKRIFSRPITQSMPVTQYKFKVSSIEKLNGKIKAVTTSGNYSKVKLMVQSPMIGREEAKRRKTEINYHTNIKFKTNFNANNELFHNVNINPYIKKLDRNIKAITYLDNYYKVKLMTENMMRETEEAKRRKIDINHIKNIKVKANNTLLFNVAISPCISENPLMKFSYKDIKPLSLTLEYTDNNGTIKTNATRVNHNSKIKPTPRLSKLSQNAKSYPTQIESIKKLYGDITLIEDGIELKAPRHAENGGSIPISIRSDIKFKSIALFSKSPIPSSNVWEASDIRCREGNEFSLISQWFGTPYSMAHFSIRIKMRYEGEVLVVLEAENGKFYTIKKAVHV